jgi:glycolate oxidase iron-sulfur subunit
MRAALVAARLARPLVRVLPTGPMFFQRLRALLTLAPARLPPPSALERPQIHPAIGQRRGRVALLTGCAQQVLDPAINEATIRLLTRIGVEVVVSSGAGCCGALTHHMGREAAALASARANIAAWSRELIEQGGEGLDAIVINASGCGTTVKDYSFMLRTDPAWRDRAARISSITADISEYLVRIGYQPTRPAPDLRVTYQAACSLQHGQQVTAEPKTLLRRAGFTVSEPAEAHLCCGSAGTYNMLQPEIATRLRARKMENLKATRPDLIASGNIGCITQLSGGGVPMVHTVQLLDWMAGGPEPAGLRLTR